MRHRIHVAALGLAAVLALAAPTRAAHDAAHDVAAPAEPPAPAKEEVVQRWRAYVAGLKATPLYEVAEAMRPEAVEPIVKAAAEDLGVTCEIRTRSLVDFVARLPGWFSVRIGDDPDRDWAELRVDNEGLADYPRLEMREQDVMRWRQETAFPVPPPLLRELAVPVVTKVVLVHPANRPLDRFAVEEQTLVEVLRTLAETGRMDYSIRADLGNQVLVTMMARRRSPLALLRLAAATTDWQLIPESVVDVEVGFEQVATRYRKADLLTLAHPDAPRIETPTDALKQLLATEGARLKGHENVVRLVHPDGAGARP